MVIRREDPSMREVADEILRLVRCGERWRSAQIRAEARGRETRVSDKALREIDRALDVQRARLSEVTRRQKAPAIA